MVTVTERFFVSPQYREAFDVYCQRLAGLMAHRQGCCHHYLVRHPSGPASHVLHSTWESLEQFKEWTHSDAFVLAANGGTGGLPEGVFLAPKRTEVEVIDGAAPAA